MTAYTSAAPFEFEGVKYQLDQFNKVRLAGTFLEILDARIVHAVYSAFIEAERDTWAWTNSDRTEARKERWVAVLDHNVWLFGHDDFNGGTRNQSPYWTRDVGSGDDRVDDVAAEVMDSFDAWHATQTPPAPAVPKVGDYIRAVIRGDWVSHVEEFEVTLITRGTRFATIHGGVNPWFINAPGETATTPWSILSWSPAERPAPAWHTPEPWSLWDLCDKGGKVTRCVAIESFGEMRFSALCEDYYYKIATDPRITAGREVTR